jgi:cytochrome c oxidase cbb3-type subunit 3/ubiquinol-cytochrome c reductase cytochrome c subunit
MTRFLASLSLLLAFSCGSGTKPAPHTNGPQANAPAEKNAVPAAPPASPALLAQQKHGGELYARICAVCHGVKGEGYKADRASALAHPEFLASTTDYFMRVAIARGRPGTVMSAWSSDYGGPLSASDVDAIIAFMRSWQTKPRVSLDERPRGGDAKRAEPVYARECAQCHGARGVGGPNIQIGDRGLLASATNGFLRHAIRHGRAGTPMPAYGEKLGDQGVEDMVALIRSFGELPETAQGATGATGAPHDPHAGHNHGHDHHGHDHAHHGHEPPKLSAPLPLGKVVLNPRGKDPVGFEVYPKMTPAKVIHDQLVAGARMAFLDARPPSDYVRKHIAGAVSVPYYDPSPYLDKLPKDTWLVSYCFCPTAESGELARKLLAHGFKKVTVLAEGLGYWEAQGWKTKSTAEAKKPQNDEKKPQNDGKPK